MAGPSIIARLGLDAGEFKRGIADAKASVGNLAGELGIGLSIGGVLAFANSMIELGGTLQDTSDKLGVDVEVLQELQYAFGQSGASAEDIDKAISKLSQTTADALSGNEKAISSFQRLGVSLEDLRKMSPDEILMEIAGSASDAQDPTQRLSDILDVLGKSGGKMAAGLNAGREALQEFRDSAIKLTKEEISVLDDAGDAIANQFNQIKIGAAKAFLGAERGFNSILDWIDHNFDNGVLKAKENAPKNPEPAPDMKAAAAAAREAEAQAKLQAEKDADLKEFYQLAQDLYNRQLEKEYAERQKAAEDNKKLIEEIEKFKFDKALEGLSNLAAAERKAAEEKEEREQKKQDRKDEIAQNARDLEKKEADKFVADELAGPDARREARRRERDEARALAKFGRMERLKNRGGKAEADVQDPFAPFKNRGGAEGGMGDVGQPKADDKNAIDLSQQAVGALQKLISMVSFVMVK